MSVKVFQPALQKAPHCREKFIAYMSSKPNPMDPESGPDSRQWVRLADYLAAEGRISTLRADLEKCQAERDALRADAERYQAARILLVTDDAEHPAWATSYDGACESPEDFDRFFDHCIAARAAQAAGSGEAVTDFNLYTSPIEQAQGGEG